MLHTKPAKCKRIIRSNCRALYGPLMDQSGALTLWGLALVSLEFIGMFLTNTTAAIIRVLLLWWINPLQTGISESLITIKLISKNFTDRHRVPDQSRSFNGPYRAFRDPIIFLHFAGQEYIVQRKPSRVPSWSILIYFLRNIIRQWTNLFLIRVILLIFFNSGESFRPLSYELK